MTCIERALERLGPWLTSPEAATIAVNGGWELTLRSRLLYELQRDNETNFRAKSEHGIEGQRADIALFGEGWNLSWLIELKHNFSFQLNEITGALRAEWECAEQQGLPDNATKTIEKGSTSSFRRDYEKWGVQKKCNVSCIQIVTRVTEIDPKAREHLKYPQEDPELTKGNMAWIDLYFNQYTTKNLQGSAYGGEAMRFEARNEEPYDLTCCTSLYVVHRHLPIADGLAPIQN